MKVHRKKKQLSGFLTGILLGTLVLKSALPVLAAEPADPAASTETPPAAFTEGTEGRELSFTLLEEPVAVQSYEGGDTQIRVYGSFTRLVGADDAEQVLPDHRLLMKRGSMIPVSSNLDYLDGRIDQVLVDSLQDGEDTVQYLSILDEEHVIRDYYTSLKWPEELSNSGIAEISSTLDTNDTVVMVRYMDNTVAAFNYLTGSLVFLDESEKQEIDFLDYVGNWVTETWNSLFGKPAEGYAKIRLLEEELKVNPIDGASLGTLLGVGEELPGEGQATGETWGELSETGSGKGSPLSDQTTEGRAGETGTEEVGEAIEAEGEAAETVEGAEETVGEAAKTAGADTEAGGTGTVGTVPEGINPEETAPEGTNPEETDTEGTVLEGTVPEEIGETAAAEGKSAESAEPGEAVEIDAEGTGKAAAEGEAAETAEAAAGETAGETAGDSKTAAAVVQLPEYLTLYDPETDSYELYQTEEYLAQATGSMPLMSEGEKLNLLKAGGYRTGGQALEENLTGFGNGASYVIVIFAVITALLCVLLLIRRNLGKQHEEE